MHKIRRVAMMAALAISAFGASAGAASALTVSNPGTLTGTDSGNVTFKATMWSLPVTVTCTTANLTGSVTSTGGATISNAGFSGCTDGFGNATTVTATSLSWSSAGVKATAGTPNTYRFDSLNARVTVQSGLGTCHYISGSLTSTSQPSPVSTIVYSNAGPLSPDPLDTGCGDGTLTGTYNLSRSLTISGV